MLTLTADGPITAPGLYLMDADAYFSDPVPDGSLSSTWARKLMEPAGPAKFAHERRNPQPPKKVFDVGHAAHTIVLGSGSPIARIPEDKLAKNGAVSTTEAKEFCAEARANGRTPLKPAEYDQVVAMAEAIKNHPEAMRVLAADGTQTEVSAFRQDPETGMWLRCRYDAVNPAGIGDLKTTTDADPAKFARKTAAELGYFMQDAWYLDTARALDLTDGPLRFVLVEKTAPYLVSVVELSDVYLHIGRTRNRAAIDLYARCRAADYWPGYTGVTVVDPPTWLLNESDEQLADDIAAELAAYAESLKTGTAA